jgi:ankyrin repeat protein
MSMRTGIVPATLLLFAAAVLAAGLQGELPSSPVVQVAYEEPREHLISDPPFVRAALPPRAAAMLAFGGISFHVTVDPFGIVRSAELNESGEEAPLPSIITSAKTAIMAQQFRPFMRGGKAVTAVFDETIGVLPPERTPSVEVAFPPIGDRKSILMTLSRSGCFGMCPTYKVEIHGDGTVIYEGHSYGAVEGRHTTHISKEDVDALLEEFRQAHYFSLEDKYEYQVTDNPTYETSLSIGGKTKKVTDYVGAFAGMPLSVSRLEDAIDRIAGTTKWVSGNHETIPALKAEGFDFKSAAASELLVNAAKTGDTESLRQLLALGTPIPEPKAGSDVLWLATLKGNVETLRVLFSSGAVPQDPARRSLMLMGASGSGVPEAVRFMLENGGDPHWKNQDGRTALFSMVGGWHTRPEKEGVDRAAVAELLVQAGADPNATDKTGMTPLIEAAWDEGAVAVLIAHGANVNARSSDGETALINCVSPSVAEVLLSHGADPRIRNDRGDDALQSAKKSGSKEKAAVIEKWLLVQSH